MILGIGTDLVQINRFDSWNKFSQDRLRNVFSANEVAQYQTLLNQGALDKASTFLASRFAAKEAFFKAFSSALVKLGLTSQTFNLTFACKQIEVVYSEWGTPDFAVNWKVFETKIQATLPLLNVQLSLSHEKDYALAFVILEGQV